MAQETTEPQGGSGRPKWMGYAQLIVIVAAIAVALYFARAPSQVEREPVSDLSFEQVKPTVTALKPTATEHALSVDVMIYAIPPLDCVHNIASGGNRRKQGNRRLT